MKKVVGMAERKGVAGRGSGTVEVKESGREALVVVT